MSDSDIVLNSFYNRTFFNSWKGNIKNNYNQLELITTDRCSLACKYCYFNKFGKYLFTEESRNEDNIFSGFQKVVEWLKRKQYHPEIMFFSGEFFQQPINIKVIEYLLDNINGGDIENVTIPVGGSFMLHNDGKEIIEYQKSFAKKKINLNFSLSVDGKFMDSNRPVRDKSIRDDLYYDKLFQFAKDTYCGFHPMVYSEGIENWPKNFLWFQSKFEEFQLPWNNIYLLDVRNNNWTDNQIKDFGIFMEFLVEWLWFKSKKDKKLFFQNIIRGGSFNILSGPFTTVGRGLGCGIQGSIHLRLGDLSIFPCHRLMKDIFKVGEFNIEEGKITDVKAFNSDLGILIKSSDRLSFPVCETCSIKNLCVGQCLGSCHETHGDPFAPIPIVCKLEHKKLFSILSALKKFDLYDEYLSMLGNVKLQNIKYLEEIVCQKI